MKAQANEFLRLGYINGWLLDYCYDPEEDRAKLVYRDPERHIGIADFVEIDGVRYTAKPPDMFVKTGAISLASDLGELKSTRGLIAIIEDYISDYFLLDECYLVRIPAYYVLLTWIYDCVDALPYLLITGAKGSGKTELMKRLGAICYRFMDVRKMANSAKFFQVFNKYGGTLFIDEYSIRNNVDISDDLINILSLGAMRGGFVSRQENVAAESGWKTELISINAFGPKMIVMQDEFWDSVIASRSLRIRLTLHGLNELIEAGINLYEDGYWYRARSIRNLLMRWRMEHWEPDIEVGKELVNYKIPTSFNRLAMPLKSIAKNDPDLQKQIDSDLQEHARKMGRVRSRSITARLIRAVERIWRGT